MYSVLSDDPVLETQGPTKSGMTVTEEVRYNQSLYILGGIAAAYLLSLYFFSGKSES